MINLNSNKILITAFFALQILAACSTKASAGDQIWDCKITRDGTDHHLSVKLHDENVIGFDYMTFTKSESGINSCSVGTEDEGEGQPKVAGNVTSFALTDTDTAIVTKNGDTIFLDLSNAKASNYCGQSSTLAAKLTIKKSLKKCVSVKDY